MITYERFEEILRKKYESGVKVFVGNVSGNKYQIQNLGHKRTGWSLFVNSKLVKTGTNFFSVAITIWDTEMESCMPD